MNCPACSAVLPAQTKDCPGCGVNVAGWKGRPLPPVSSAPRADAGVGAGVVIPALIAAAVIGWAFWPASKPPAPAAAAPGPDAAAAAPASAPAASPMSANRPAGALDVREAFGAGLPLEGFDAVWSEYEGRVSAYGAQPGEAKRFFKIGVEEAALTDFDAMTEEGYPVSETPFESDERQKAGGAMARCDGPDGRAYLPSLPREQGRWSQCWARVARHAKSTREFLVIYSPAIPGYSWALAQFGRDGWSPWPLESRLAAARSYAEKRYGAAQQELDRKESEKQLAELDKRGGSAADKSNAVFVAFRSRFRLEGTRAELERLSR